MNTERLNILISATDEASRVINNITSSLFSLKGIGIAAAVTGIAYFAKSSFEAFANLDRELRKSLSMFGNFSDELYNRAMKVVREIPKEIPYISAQEAARGLWYLASAGMDAETALKVLPTIAKFAEVNFTDMSRASDTAMVIMKTFGYSADELTIALDKMTKAQKMSMTTMDELQEAFSYAAPAAVALGVSIDDLLATLDIFADAGIRGSQAGTALRRIMMNLAAGDEKTLSILKELNIEVYDAQGRFRGLSDILIDLIRGMQGTTDQQKIMYLLGLSDIRAISALSAVINRGEGALIDLKKQIQDANGLMEEQAKIIETGPSAKYELLKNKIYEAKIQFGAFVYDLTQNKDIVLTFINPTLEAFTKLVDFLKEKWGEITSGWSNVWNIISSTFSNIGNKIGEFLSGAWNDLVTTISGFKDTIGDAFSTAFTIVWNTLSSWAGKLKGFFNDYVLSPIINAINKIIDFYNATLAKLPGLPELERLSLPGTAPAPAATTSTSTSTTNINMWGVTIVSDPRELVQKIMAITGK